MEKVIAVRMDEKIAEKRHAKNSQNYKTATLTITAPEESDLHEITLTCIKTLDSNGAWDFEVQHSEQRNIIPFKYNGTIAALDAVSRLHFQCDHDMKWEWHHH